MPLSRRTFLSTLAALPLAQRVNGQSAPKVIVIGAGAFGGWTALHLLSQGADVTLVDAWGPGNSRASSGGETRVIRAIYGPDRLYVEMVKRAYELWEEIDMADEPLYVETGALWMHRGSDAYVQSSAPILKDLGFPLEQMTVAEAARRYPQINFGGIKSVWLERRAGALSARRACGVVRDTFVEAGGTYRTAHAEPAEIRNERLTGVRLDDGTRADADSYVFACGPWLGRVFPDVIGDAVRSTRQEVYYFGTPRGSNRYRPDQFPVWIDFGERIFYGIPDAHGRGFKVADDTRGEPFDPTNGNRAPSDEGVARVRGLLAERFPELAKAPLVSAEVCQYENSPDGHLIMDRHPGAKNVWILGGGSGHGFKLSPAVGEMAAGAMLSGHELPALFALARLKDAKKPSTQFDRK